MPCGPRRRLEAKGERLRARGGGWRTPPWLVAGGVGGGRRGDRVRGGRRWGMAGWPHEWSGWIKLGPGLGWGV